MKKWKIPWPGQWTKKRKLFHHSLLYSGKDFIVSAALFFLTVLLCLLLRSVDPHSDTSYVAVLFFLDVFLTALLTDGYLFSILIAVTRRAVRGLCVHRALLGDQLHAGGISADVYRHDVHFGGHPAC